MNMLSHSNMSYPPYYMPEQYHPEPQKEKPYQKYSNTLQKAIEEKYRQQQKQQQQNYQSSGDYRQYYQNPVKDISYLDLFRTVLNEYENTHTMINEQYPGKFGQQYSLYEDLKLLTEILGDGNSSSMYKRLSDQKIIERSYESIRTRCMLHLMKLKNSDYDSILTYIEIYGIHGYLNFTNKNGEKKLKNISRQVDKQNQDSQRQADEAENENQKKIGKQSQPQQSQETGRLDLKRKLIKIEDENKNTTEDGQKSVKKLQKINNSQDVIPQSYFQNSQTLQNKEKVLSEELDVVLTVLCQWEDEKKNKLVKWLDQLSGDLNQLDEYLSSRNDESLWTEEDDEILKKSTSEKSGEIKLLTRMKGTDSLKRRLQYKKFQIPYQIK